MVVSDLDGPAVPMVGSHVADARRSPRTSRIHTGSTGAAAVAQAQSAVDTLWTHLESEYGSGFVNEAMRVDPVEGLRVE